MRLMTPKGNDLIKNAAISRADAEFDKAASSESTSTEFYLSTIFVPLTIPRGNEEGYVSHVKYSN